MAAIRTHDGVVAVISGISIAVTDVRSPTATKIVTIPSLLEDKPKQPEKKKKRDEGDSSQRDEDSSGGKNRVLASCFSPNGRYFAVCDDNKQLHVYSTTGQDWTLLSSRPVTRRATSVLFTKDELSVLVGDKSGDVYSFPTVIEDQEGNQVKEIEAKDTSEVKDDGEGEVKGQLLLGHLSMLVDMCLAWDERYIVTSDRDEKIRVSHFPNAYNIHTYCLGHTEFVNCLIYVQELSVLVSGSGDCTLRVWNMEGKQLCQAKALQQTPLPADSSENLQCASELKNDDSSCEGVGERSGDAGWEGVKEERELRERPAIQKMAYCRRCRLLAVAFYRCPQIQMYRLSLEEEGDGGVTLTLTQTLPLSTPPWDISFDDSNCTLWVLSPVSGDTLTAYRTEESPSGNVQLYKVEDEENAASKLASTVNSNWDFFRDSLNVPSQIPTLWKIATQDHITEYQQRKQQRLLGQKGQLKKQGSNPHSADDRDENGEGLLEKKARVA